MKQILLAVLLAVTAQASASPNFLIILTDDQSWTGTSTRMDPALADSKSDYYRTPNMDRLLTAGMRFPNGYASGAWCTPSRRSIQIGQFPPRHTYNRNLEGMEQKVLAAMTIPRALKAANPAYACAHFGKWHLDLNGVTPEALGYDASDGDTDNSDGEWAKAPGFTGTATAKDVPDVWQDPKRVFDLSRRTGDFIELQTRSGKPWMVQLSEYAVHLKVSYRQQTLDGLKDRPKGSKHAIPEFAAMTEDLDTAIGQLLTRLDRLGALENTYVIYLSDNGGRDTIPIAGSPAPRITQGRNYPLAESKHSIYEGGLRVPFAISGPGIKPGSFSNVPVSGVDILPTIADLAGCKGSLGDAVDGGSLKGVATGASAPVERPAPYLVFQSKNSGESPRLGSPSGKHQPFTKAAIRQGDYKLVTFYYDNPSATVVELFDLSKDQGETTDLSARLPEVTARLVTQLAAYMEKVGGLVELPAGSVPVDKKKKKRK